MTKLFILGAIFIVISSCVSVNAYTFEQKKVVHGHILYVGGGGPGNYTTIQGAISAANDGDTIFVYHRSMPYYENVVIDKTITLSGEDRNSTIIDGNGTGDVIHLFPSSERTTISGFTIQNSGIPGFLGGITIQNQGSNIVKGNIITKNWNGITIYYSNDNTITENIITGNDDGIQILGSNNSVIGNVIQNLEIDDSHYNRVVGNLIIGNLLLYGRCGLNVVSKNNLERGASFQLIPGAGPVRNEWDNNFWNRTRILPKPIFGMLMWGDSTENRIPWVQFDRHPAQKPFDIG